MWSFHLHWCRTAQTFVWFLLVPPPIFLSALSNLDSTCQFPSRSENEYANLVLLYKKWQRQPQFLHRVLHFAGLQVFEIWPANSYTIVVNEWMISGFLSLKICKYHIFFSTRFKNLLDLYLGLVKCSLKLYFRKQKRKIFSTTWFL